MNKVFVIQDSPGKNLGPAKEYGDLTIMLHGDENSISASSKLLHHLEDFNPAMDFLLLIGNPVFIAIASMILTSVAHETRQRIKVLVWDREHYKYNVESIYA